MLFYMHILFCVTLSYLILNSPILTESFHPPLECYMEHHAPSCCDALSCIGYDGYGSFGPGDCSNLPSSEGFYSLTISFNNIKII